MQIKLCNKEISLGAVAEMTIDECPNLGLFYNCYQESAIQWMLDQLSVINIIANVTNRLNDTQMTMLANDIIREHTDLNLAEICIFLVRLRTGRYGTFYNSIDNIKIMEALRLFRKERISELESYARMKDIVEREERKKRWAKDAITYEEYKRLKGGDDTPCDIFKK